VRNHRLVFTVLLNAQGEHVVRKQAAVFMGLCYWHGLCKRRWVLMRVKISPHHIDRLPIAMPMFVVSSGECSYTFQARIAITQAAVRVPAHLKGPL